MGNLIFATVFIPPLLYAVGNILDKQLVSRGGSSSPTLIVTISSLFSVIISPLIFIFFEIQTPLVWQIPVMISSGMLTVLSVFLYLTALKGESIFSVAPALQLTPVFSYFIGLFLFQEVVSFLNLIGCSLIIIGALFLTLKIEKTENKNKFNFNIFFITSLSSLALAVSGAMFKFFATRYNYWTVQFYEYVGLLIVGVVLFLLLSRIRDRIFEMFTLKKSKSFLLLNIATEGVMVLGDLTLNMVVLLVPMVIAFSFNALQPVFLLLLGLSILKISKKINTHLIIDSYDYKTLFFSLVITIGVIIVVIF